LGDLGEPFFQKLRIAVASDAIPFTLTSIPSKNDASVSFAGTRDP